MVINSSRLRELTTKPRNSEESDSDSLIAQIQAHPYVEEVPTIPKDEVKPYYEDHDEIRALNILINQAKCAAIRDRQLIEKKLIKQELEVYEQNMDLEVEVARIENIRKQDESFHLTFEKQKENAKNIKVQMVEKRLKSSIEKEERKKESENQQKQYQLQSQEEEQKKKILTEKKKEFTRAIIESNQQASTKRQEAKENELAMDKQMLQYTLQKIEKEEQLEKQRKEKRLEMERAYAKSLMEHKRKSEMKSNKQDISAMKAAYDFEMKSRKEEEEKKNKAHIARLQLIEERQRLKLLKENTIAKETEKAKLEYQDILRQQQEVDEKMRVAQKLKKEQLNQFLIDIKAQIEEKKKAKLESSNKFYAELHQFNEEIQTKQIAIEQLKMEKVKQLQQLGIPEKYLHDVKKYIK
eukprot:NODE_15_length_50561_cov_0.608081.p11 type:complete len:410 gc:universal NODE_15_length_50561_cov_0.608081:7517-6288(-)